MIHAFVFEKIAVLVEPFHVKVKPPEKGARVEVRLLDSEPRRGSGAAAQRVVVDQPVFRADLFDRLDQPPGNMERAHFHPTFEGVEPCKRHWQDDLKTDPTGWLSTELSDLAALLGRSGLVDPTEPWVPADTEALRAAVPEVIVAVESVWRSLGIPRGAETNGWSTRLNTQKYVERLRSGASALRSRVATR